MDFFTDDELVLVLGVGEGEGTSLPSVMKLLGSELKYCAVLCDP
jgi:hypothetical protein